MKFNTANEMLEYLDSKGDIYSPSQEFYVFMYNDLRSICVYSSISETDADELDSLTTAGWWDSELGYRNNEIYDSDEWSKDRGYSIDEYNNLSWCNDHLDITDWVDTKDWRS